MKKRATWYSERVQQDVTVTRWGHIGTPILIFPTAGGDAEEIERFQMISALSEYLKEGLIKIYSCDSVAGRAMVAEEGSPEHRMWLMNQFQEFVRREFVPWIHLDCRTDDIGMLTAGASIGAFQALAAICRYPDVFTAAICMSGTYDLQRFLKASPNQDFFHASPIHWLPHAKDEAHLDALRRRFVLLASGEGRAENIEESWKTADVLGSKGIPNRVDSWGPEWHHDWPTWRNMLHQYVPEMLERDG